MKASSNRIKKVLLGLAVAVLLPLSFYAIVKGVGKDKVYLPGYYATVGDSVRKVPRDSMSYFPVYKAGELHAINQLGHHVTLNDSLGDRILVVNFFFINCPTICPRLTSNMAMLSNAYRRTSMKQNEDLVQFVSITVNPGLDTVEALRNYADRYKANHDHWWFLTGDKKELYDYARDQLHLSVPAGDGGVEDFIHTEQIVLLDKDRNIRGYYNGLDSLAIRDLASDIGLLDMEKKRSDRAAR